MNTLIYISIYIYISAEVTSCHGRYIIGGDFNARIHYLRKVDTDVYPLRTKVDTDVCGPYIIGRGMEYLNNMSDQAKESRAHWCKTHHLKILNSQFSKLR